MIKAWLQHKLCPQEPEPQYQAIRTEKYSGERAVVYEGECDYEASMAIQRDKIKMIAKKKQNWYLWTIE